MEFKNVHLGIPYSDTDEERRVEALKKARQREESFRKSEDKDDVIKKRMGMDMFKGGME